MKAELLLRKRLTLTATTFVEMVVWRVPQPVKGSLHNFKYRAVLVSEGECLLRYDNEAGKGDHRHIEGRETAYQFVDVQQLERDFWADVELWRQKQ